MTLLLVHAAATAAMTGLIWFVQLVHYPLFPYADRGSFVEFAAAHQSRTSWIVGPVMTIELVTAALLVASPRVGSTVLAAVGLAILVAIWISTALIQVPLHRRLSHGFDRRSAARLVRTNWLRTVAWSGRSILAFALLAAVD